MDPLTKLARTIAGAPDTPNPFTQNLQTAAFGRGLVCAVNADGSVSVLLNGSPTAINADCLSSVPCGTGSVVEVHTFGSRVVVHGLLGLAPSARMYASNFTGLGAGAVTPVGYMTSNWAVGGMTFNGTTNAITVPVDGFYTVSWSVLFQGASGATVPAGYYNSTVLGPGSAILREASSYVYTSSVVLPTVGNSDDIYLTAGETLQLGAQTGAAGCYTYQSGVFTYLSVRLATRYA